ncbi:MAG: 2-hydroxyacid dehydrogenase [Rhabdochlamydiaceae bacterium]
MFKKKYRVYITRKIRKEAFALLSDHFDVYENPCDSPLSYLELCEIVKNYDAILSTISEKIDSFILSHADKVKVIANYATGTDNIDVKVAQQKGIKVLHLSEAVTNSTADLTFALLLSMIRKIPQALEYVKNGQWTCWEPELLLGEELFGKTFGIIGYGRIGQAVAKRAHGFGLKVIHYHPHRSIISGYSQQLSLDELFAESDYISLHVPLTNETKKMLSFKEFKKMKKKPIVINMARGSVIDSVDLVRALGLGLVRGVALDVTDPEPISPHHPLCHFSNCFVIPHLGSATLDCRSEMAIQSARQIINYFHDLFL